MRVNHPVFSEKKMSLFARPFSGGRANDGRSPLRVIGPFQASAFVVVVAGAGRSDGGDGRCRGVMLLLSAMRASFSSLVGRYGKV